MDDKTLARALRRGDPKALEAAIDGYTAYVSAVITHQLSGGGTRQDVEELCANCFLALWQQRERLRGHHLRGWLGAVARNEARMFLRRQKLQTVPEEDLLLLSEDCAQRFLDEKERLRCLRAALDRLEPCDRELVLRRYYYNQSVPDIAAALGLHPEAAKSRLRRSRDKLKRILTEGDCAL